VLKPRENEKMENISKNQPLNTELSHNMGDGL
jgi:hypothetical protein